MRQALEMALEALEEFGEHYDWCHQFPTYAFPENYPPCNCGYDKAITAIKEALAQPEQAQEKTSWTLEDVKMSWKSGYKLGLEKAQKQEPVAHCTVRPLRGDEFYPKTEIIWVKGRPVAGPLYTTPPQRKPLTDEQLKAMSGNSLDIRIFKEIARAIEQAHGIKE